MDISTRKVRGHFDALKFLSETGQVQVLPEFPILALQKNVQQRCSSNGDHEGRKTERHPDDQSSSALEFFGTQRCEKVALSATPRERYFRA